MIVLSLDILNNLKQCKELLKLKRKYPGCDGFITLGCLFPMIEDLDEDETLIAYKNVGCGKKIYEDKNCFGYVDSSVIPIEYHSSYSYAVSLLLSKYIDDNRDFFEEFLKDYEVIIVDRECKNKDGTLVIRDYNHLYKFEDFVREILKNYSLSDEDFEIIFNNLSCVDDDFSYTEVLKMQYFEEFLEYFVKNKKFYELRLLFDNCDDMKSFKNKYKSSKSFDILNELIDRLSDEFIINNFLVIEEAFSGAKRNVDFSTIASKDIRSGAYVDRYTVIKLALNILNSLDPSGKFSRSFENAVRDWKVVMWEPLERERICKYYEELGYDPSNGIESCFFQILSRDDGFINLPLTNTIEDVISLIHEFVHYYSLIGVKEYEHHADYLSELVCIYFETRACDWLIEHGYPEDEVFKLLNYRNANDGFNNTVAGVESLISLRSKKNSFGEIDFSNVLDEDELEHKVVWNEFMWNLTNNDKLYSTLEDDIKNNYVLQCIDSLLNMFYKDERALLISYTLGTYYATRYRSDDMDSRMMFVANNLTNPNYDSIELMRVLQDGVPSIIGGTKNKCLEYVKKEEK